MLSDYGFGSDALGYHAGLEDEVVECEREGEGCCYWEGSGEAEGCGGEEEDVRLALRWDFVGAGGGGGG